MCLVFAVVFICVQFCFVWMCQTFIYINSYKVLKSDLIYRCKMCLLFYEMGFHFQRNAFSPLFPRSVFLFIFQSLSLSHTHVVHMHRTIKQTHYGDWFDETENSNIFVFVRVCVVYVCLCIFMHVLIKFKNLFTLF